MAVKSRAFSIISTGIFLANPVAAVQAVSLIFSFGWMNAIALVVIIIGGIVIQTILIHIHDCQVWKRIIGNYFFDFDDCFFEPVTIKLEQDLKKIRDVLRSLSEKDIFLSRVSQMGQQFPLL